jgi:hypothetical protein
MIIVSMSIQVWVFSCIAVPVVPGTPVATIVVHMFFVIEVVVMTMAIIGALPVPMMASVIAVAVIGSCRKSYDERGKETKERNNDSFHRTPHKKQCFSWLSGFILARERFVPRPG